MSVKLARKDWSIIIGEDKSDLNSYFKNNLKPHFNMCSI